MKEYTVKVDDNGNKFWYLDGNLHREDGPAVEWGNGTKEWYLDGKRHREAGPAIEWSNGTKVWYFHGKLHREDGPAIERADGDKSWCLDGEPVTEKEHKRRTSGVTMDDALAAGDAVILREQAARIKELEAQRDELLEALEKIVELNGPGRIYKLNELGMLVSTMLSIARAAIAKAKGEE